MKFSIISLFTFFLFFNSNGFSSENLLMEWGSAKTARLPLNKTYHFMTWNIYKGGYEGLYGDYERFVDQYDFIATQEFLLNENQANLIDRTAESHHWALAKSFRDNGAWTGVATVSKWQPLDSTPAKSPGREPLVGTPKMSLISRYSLEGGRTLMVVNVHGLNFNLTHGDFKDQIDDVVAKIRGHQGPLIFAGDFNTWSDTRRDYLIQKTQGLGLRRAQLENPMGFYSTTLDHIFYRGITVLEERVITFVSTSDHLPMTIKFRF